jgi:hypothetical protein
MSAIVQLDPPKLEAGGKRAVVTHGAATMPGAGPAADAYSAWCLTGLWLTCVAGCHSVQYHSSIYAYHIACIRFVERHLYKKSGVQ